MGLWQSITAMFSTPMQAEAPQSSFAIEVPPELMEAMTAGGAIAPRISRNEALQVPAVMRARNLIAGTLGSLPVTTIGPDRREVDGTYLLGGNIDPDIPNSVMMSQTFEDLLFEGISWWRVMSFGWHDYPTTARHVPWQSVHVSGSAGLPSETQVSADQPFPVDGQVFIDGYPVPDREIIRFDGPNPPLLRHAARAIRTALKLDRASALYADDPLPLAVFTPKEGVDPGDRDHIQRLLDDWEQARSRRATGYVGAALELKTLGWSPEQLQLADARQHAVLEIARAAGIDPEDLGVSTTTRTYQNSEQRRQDLMDFTLGAYVSALQDRLSMRDVLPRRYKAKIKFEGFLRSDTKTRMETYAIGRPVGAYDDKRIADLEDLPVEQVQTAREQGAPNPQPAITSQGQLEADVPAATFDTDAETRLSFDDPEAYASFRVNEAKRTISGMVVPWGKVAVSRGSRWRFAENSLRWGDASRVKLNLGHDRTQSVGYAAALRNTSQGLDVTFKIAEVPEGDRAIALAAGKAWDGLSIEIDFEDDFGDDWQADPQDRTTRLVQQAKLKHVALTPAPAFDDARVATVAASRSLQGGNDGHDEGRPEDRAGRRGPRVRVRSRRLH